MARANIHPGETLDKHKGTKFDPRCLSCFMPLFADSLSYESVSKIFTTQIHSFLKVRASGEGGGQISFKRTSGGPYLTWGKATTFLSLKSNDGDSRRLVLDACFQRSTFRGADLCRTSSPWWGAWSGASSRYFGWPEGPSPPPWTSLTTASLWRRRSES